MKTSFSNKNWIAFGIMLIFYAVGVVGFSLSFTRSIFISLTPFILLLSLFFVAFYHKGRNHNYTMVFYLFVFLASFLIEVWGVHSGVIFGNYAYGKGLGIKIAETPLLIGVNWVLLVYLSAVVFSALRRSVWSWIVLPSALMLMYDVVMEQVASKMDMWSWQGDIIPLQNYLMWAVLAIFFHSVRYKLKIEAINKMALPLFGVQMLFFILILIIN